MSDTENTQAPETVAEEVATPGFVKVSVRAPRVKDIAFPHSPIGHVPSVDFELAVGENLQEAIEAYGETLVYNYFVANAKVVAQGVARAHLEAGKAPADVLSFMNSYTLGTKTERSTVDPRVAFMTQFKSSSPEEQAELLKTLRGLAGQ